MIANVKYTFNILNLAKINSQYNYGMQPVTFSVIDYIRNNRGLSVSNQLLGGMWHGIILGWRHTGEEILYHGNNYTDGNEKQFRTLTFALNFQYGNDYVYIAYHYPYTFTRLMVRTVFNAYQRTLFEGCYCV